MTAEEYVTSRLDDQISWYDRKSGKNKKCYLFCRWAELCLAALIPFLAGAETYASKIMPTVIGVMGILIAIAGGTSSLLQFNENWIKYRTTAESLKKEKYLFVTKVEPYNAEDAFPTLVQRVETLVSQENTNWAQYMMRPGKETEHGKANLHQFRS